MKRPAAAFIAIVLAACSDRPMPPPETATGSATPEATVEAPPITAPAGVSANGHLPPSAPTGVAVWVVDPAKESVTVSVGTKGGGRVTWSAKSGVAGGLDGESGKAVFTIDLTTLASTDAAGKTDAARDGALTEAFFAAKSPEKPAVKAIWRALDGKLAVAVPRAALVIEKVPIPVSMIVSPPAKVNPDYVEKSTLEASLIMWNSVAIPLSLPIEMSRRGNRLDVKSSSPAKIDLTQAVGPAIWGRLIDATAEAGYPDARDSSSEIEISLQASLTLSR